jgi:hypothetical protein
LGVVLEEFLQPLAATLGYVARVLPAAWGPGSGLDAWHRLRVLGEGLGARLYLCALVMDWFFALHGFALLSLRALVDLMVQEYSAIAGRVPARCGSWVVVPICPLPLSMSC